MNEAAYRELLSRSDRALYEFVTEKDSSERKWAAIHLLEERRNKRLTSAAKWSAIAAWVAAVIAGVSLTFAVLRSEPPKPVAVYATGSRSTPIGENELCIDGTVFMRVGDRYLSRTDDGKPIAAPCTFVTPD